MPNRDFVLSIDAAIGKGSLALFSANGLVATSDPAGDVSRAEQLLPAIDELLINAGKSKGSLAKVLVSVGPGSFTGIRIGIATAMGLAASLSIPWSGFSALQALANSSPESTRVGAAVPIGTSTFAVQSFEKNSALYLPVAAPSAHQIAEFQIAEAAKIGVLVIHEDLVGSKVEDNAKAAGIEVVTPDLNVANLIFHYASKGGTESSEPIYVSSHDRNNRLA